MKGTYIKRRIFMRLMEENMSKEKVWDSELGDRKRENK